MTREQHESTEGRASAPRSFSRAIVIPLFAHANDAEIGELLDELKRIGVDGAYVVDSAGDVVEIERVEHPYFGGDA